MRADIERRRGGSAQHASENGGKRHMDRKRSQLKIQNGMNRRLLRLNWTKKANYLSRGLRLMSEEVYKTLAINRNDILGEVSRDRYLRYI